jgi:hypothetical protein
LDSNGPWPPWPLKKSSVVRPTLDLSGSCSVPWYLSLCVLIHPLRIDL